MGGERSGEVIQGHGEAERGGRRREMIKMEKLRDEQRRIRDNNSNNKEKKKREQP